MKPTVFLLTDTQIKEESFLEDVDSLLNTGEVPNLFAVDEKAEINEVSVKTRMDWYSTWTDLCASNLLFLVYVFLPVLFLVLP